jgi:hypothetical protein
MYKKVSLIMAVVCVLVLAGSALANPPKYTGTVIAYDGWLHQNYLPPVGGVFQNILADTLIVVNNGHHTQSMNVYIQVYDKHGYLEAESTFYNGGSLLVGDTLPPQSYGWITLGMLVNRGTHDPYGEQFTDRGEKFLIKVSSSTGIPLTVEIKQVIYTDPQMTPYPGEHIWNTNLFKTWTETSLGGKNGNGVVYSSY